MKSRALIATLLWIASVGPARAKERLEMRVDHRSGLDVANVHTIAQDSYGFIWIGTPGALFRYDGDQARRWTVDPTADDGAASRFSGEVFRIAAGLDGEVVFLNDDGQVYRAHADREGYRPVPGPDGAPIAGAVDVAFDSRGRLWVAFTESIAVRDLGGRWAHYALGTHRRENLAPQPDGSVWVATRTGVWRFTPDGQPRRVHDEPLDVVAILPLDSDGFLLALHHGEVVEIRGGIKRTVLHMRARAMDLLKRGDTVWASFDRFLVALRGEEEPEVIGPTDTGRLIVDRDGSLWMGSFTGVVQFPEPETVIWTDDDGLPSSHANFLQSDGENVWVATWQGVGRIQHTHQGWHASVVPPGYSYRICLDPLGRLWGGKGGRVWSRVGDRHTLHPEVRGEGTMYGCAPSPRASGGAWLATGGALLYADPEADEPTVVALASERYPFYDALLEDRRGNLWVSSWEKICRSTVQGLMSGREEWSSCQTYDDIRRFVDLLELPSGSLWAATESAGVMRWNGDVWVEHPLNRELQSQYVLGLETSPSGGVWLLGHGTVERVEETSGGGVRVLESLSSWHGLPIRDARDIIEEGDGDLWLTTASGVVQIPASARFSRMTPPTMRLIDVNVDGVSQPLEDLTIPHSARFVTIQFAAFSYRDRSLLRYRVRLRDDMPWSAFNGEPVFRIPRPDPGRYAAEVQASLDGEAWSSLGARIDFLVAAPWFRRVDVLTGLGAAIAVALFLAHRAVVTRELAIARAEARARSETRMRIARDLHDRVAADVASVRLRASVAADRCSLDSDREDFEEIETRVNELGNSISEIVEMLSPGPISLDAFMDEVAITGRRLFVKDRPRFDHVATASSAHLLSSAQHEALLFIAKEGLRNALQHADADNVTLRLETTPGKWRLSIVDDGHGLPAGHGHGHEQGNGHGLANMRARADEIGATILWSLPSSGGTRVSVDFVPAGRSSPPRAPSG